MKRAQSYFNRWIGNEPSWNILLTNGSIHFAVTKSVIKKTQELMYQSNTISYYDLIFDVVRECDIQNYNRFYTELKGATP